MARNWTCGFEMNDGNQADGEITSKVGSPTTAAVARSGWAGLRARVILGVAQQYIIKKHTYPTGNKHWIRFYFEVKTAPAALTKIFEWSYNFFSATPYLSVRINSDRTLEFWDESGTATQIGSDTTALVADTYYKIDVENDFNAGTAEMWVNDVSVASGSSLGNSQCNYLTLGIIDAAIAEFHFDDIAVNDDTGSYENTRPRGGHVFVAMPAGDGDTQQGARGGSDSGTNYGQVDERPWNDATDYWTQRGSGTTTVFEVGGFFEATVWLQVYPNATPVLVHVGTRQMGDIAGRICWYYLRIKSQSSGTLSESAGEVISSATWTTNKGSLADRPYMLTQYTDPQTGGKWRREHFGGMQIGCKRADINLGNTKTTCLWIMGEVQDIGMDVIKNGLIPWRRRL